jgi:hypothetical protein
MPEAKTAHSELPGNVTRLPPPGERGPSEPRRLPPLTSPAPDPDKEARRAEKRLRELSEPVEPWERYRALRQTLDEAQKFEDLADHKARFAMILMGALNALLLVLALSESSGVASLASQPWIVGYLLLCGSSAIYLFHQAIEALRPRSSNRPRSSVRDAGGEPAEAGLRHHDEVLRQDQEAYLSAWQRVCVEQLNREIARQVHQQAQVNQAKERALTRLYAGLRVMMFLLVGLVLILVTGPRSTTTPPDPRGTGTGDPRMQGREPGPRLLGPRLPGLRQRDLRNNAGS